MIEVYLTEAYFGKLAVLVWSGLVSFRRHLARYEYPAAATRVADHRLSEKHWETAADNLRTLMGDRAI